MKCENATLQIRSLSSTAPPTTQNTTSKTNHPAPTRTSSYNRSFTHTSKHTKRHKTSSSWKQYHHSSTTSTHTTMQHSPSADKTGFVSPTRSSARHTYGRMASTSPTSSDRFTPSPLLRPSSMWNRMPTSPSLALLEDRTGLGFIHGAILTAQYPLVSGRLQGQSEHCQLRTHFGKQPHYRHWPFGDH